MEEELIASNITIINLKQFKEIYGAVFPAYLQRRLERLGVIIFIAGLAVIAYMKIKDIPITMGLTFPLAGLVIFLMGVTLKNREAKKKFKDLCFRYHVENEIKRTIQFSNEKITVEMNGQEPSYIEYNEIKEILTTEHYYIMQCDEHRYLFIDQNGFTKGNFDLVHALIEQNKLLLENN